MADAVAMIGAMLESGHGLLLLDWSPLNAVLSLGTILQTLTIDCALLGVLLFTVARHNAARDMFHLLIVAGGTALCELAAGAVLAPHIGMFHMIVVALLCGVLLVRVAGASPAQAAIISGVFFAVKIGVELAFNYVMAGT